MQILDILPGTTKWLFLIAVVAFYAIGWVAWRVQNDCMMRGYGAVATTFWSVGTLFCFFPVFPVYLLLRRKMGVKRTFGAADSTQAAVLQVLCLKCGQDTPADLTACVHCGQPLAAADAPSAIGSAACMVCGAQNPIGSQTCSSCGQWL